MKRRVFDMTSLVPIVRNAGEGDKQSFAGGGLHLWKLLAEDTGGAFFLFEDTMVRDKTTPLHLHPEAHELTYVIDGEIEVEADGVRQRVRSGGLSFVPKGVAHAFIVVSAEARLIGMQTPGRRPVLLPRRERPRHRRQRRQARPRPPPGHRRRQPPRHHHPRPAALRERHDALNRSGRRSSTASDKRSRTAAMTGAILVTVPVTLSRTDRLPRERTRRLVPSRE